MMHAGSQQTLIGSGALSRLTFTGTFPRGASERLWQEQTNGNDIGASAAPAPAGTVVKPFERQGRAW